MDENDGLVVAIDPNRIYNESECRLYGMVNVGQEKWFITIGIESCKDKGIIESTSRTTSIMDIYIIQNASRTFKKDYHDDLICIEEKK